MARLIGNTFGSELRLNVWMGKKEFFEERQLNCRESNLFEKKDEDLFLNQIAFAAVQLRFFKELVFVRPHIKTQLRAESISC